MRPGTGELACNSEAPKSSETYQVEPDGAEGEILHLTWGDLRRQKRKEKSAEAVVVRIAGESRKERRAEGARQS